eukprot:SAG31_NODE_36364_length_314_cov_0.716279_1_plen_72_part_10
MVINATCSVRTIAYRRVQFIRSKTFIHGIVAVSSLPAGRAAAGIIVEPVHASPTHTLVPDTIIKIDGNRKLR